MHLLILQIVPDGNVVIPSWIADLVGGMALAWLIGKGNSLGKKLDTAVINLATISQVVIGVNGDNGMNLKVSSLEERLLELERVPLSDLLKILAYDGPERREDARRSSDRLTEWVEQHKEKQ